MLRLISRIRERDGILGFAQLVGIKYNQTIIGKIFAQLRRELLEGAVVRNGSPTCAYHYKQMVVIHLPGQYQQIPPIIQTREVRQGLSILFLHQCLQLYSCFLVCKEMYPAAQRTAHPAKMLHPLLKACFVFRLGRNGNDDSPYRINRNQEFGNHNFAMQSFQQVLGKHTEERVYNIDLTVQTDNHIGHLIFFRRMDNTRSNIQVIPCNLAQRHIGRSRNHGRLLQIPFTAKLQTLGSIVVIDYVQSQQIIFLFGITYQQGQVHQIFNRIRICHRNKNPFRLNRTLLFQMRLAHGNLACGPFRNKGAHHTCHKNQQYRTVQHILIQQTLTVRQDDIITHQYRRQRSCCLCIAQAKHQLTLYGSHFINFLRQPGSDPLAHQRHNNHNGSHLQSVSLPEDNMNINQHAHPYQEIGYEQSVTDKLQMIHQR